MLPQWHSIQYINVAAEEVVQGLRDLVCSQLTLAQSWKIAYGPPSIKEMTSEQSDRCWLWPKTKKNGSEN